MLRKPSNHSAINVTRVTLHMNNCESNNDCMVGAYCFRHRCICPFNMIMKDGLCQRMFPISHERGFFLFRTIVRSILKQDMKRTYESISCILLILNLKYYEKNSSTLFFSFCGYYVFAQLKFLLFY